MRVLKCVVDREGMGELFAGTPRMATVTLFLSLAMELELMLMILAVNCTFLFGSVTRSVCVDPRYGASRTFGKLKRPCTGLGLHPRIVRLW